MKHYPFCVFSGGLLFFLLRNFHIYNDILDYFVCLEE